MWLQLPSHYKYIKVLCGNESTLLLLRALQFAHLLKTSRAKETPQGLLQRKTTELHVILVDRELPRRLYSSQGRYCQPRLNTEVREPVSLETHNIQFADPLFLLFTKPKRPRPSRYLRCQLIKTRSMAYTFRTTPVTSPFNS